jgi:hypothetical protein
VGNPVVFGWWENKLAVVLLMRVDFANFTLDVCTMVFSDQPDDLYAISPPHPPLSIATT